MERGEVEVLPVPAGQRTMGRTKQTVNRAGRGFRAIEVDGWMEATRENLEMLLVKELKDELRFHGLRKGGRKSELIDYILETIPTIRTVAVPTRIQGWRNPATGEWKPDLTGRRVGKTYLKTVAWYENSLGAKVHAPRKMGSEKPALNLDR